MKNNLLYLLFILCVALSGCKDKDVHYQKECRVIRVSSRSADGIYSVTIEGRDGININNGSFTSGQYWTIHKITLDGVEVEDIEFNSKNAVVKVYRNIFKAGDIVMLESFGKRID